MEPFRILIIDDEFYGTIKTHQGPLSTPFDSSSPFSFLNDFLSPKAGALRNNVEIFVSYDGAFDSHDVVELVSGSTHKRTRFSGSKLWQWLKGINLLVLDLGGITIREPYPDKEAVLNNFRAFLPEHTLPENRLEFSLEQTGSGDVRGVGFYHQFLQQGFGRCKTIIILTAWDNLSTKSDELPPDDNRILAVRELLHPFCSSLKESTASGTAKSHPWTTLFPKQPRNPESGELLRRRIVSQSSAYVGGATNPSNQDAVELAAMRDAAVLLIGESGTGKELLATQIHKRWVLEKQHKHRDFPDVFVTLNCAALTEALARSELFGHVAGSFTGASDHRFGAILAACGLSGAASRRRNPAKQEENKLAEELRIVGELIELLGTDVASDTTEARARRSRVFQHLHTLFPGNSVPQQSQFNSLRNVLRRAAQVAAHTAAGNDKVRDFYQALITSSDGLLRPVSDDTFGLEFTEEGACGTLFLDEIGDLPAPVQTLLLRFLDESTREIQPVGFPGVIRGVRVRLIAATSDPRVAALCGVTDLLGNWRTTQENDRPLRADLIFRLKQQVIRVEPVSAENFDQVFDDLWTSVVNRTAKENATVWHPDARIWIKERVFEVLKQIREARPGDGFKPVFGHRREIFEFMRLIQDYVSTTQLRGYRSLSEDGLPSVTKEIVRALWRPARVLCVESKGNLSFEAASVAGGTSADETLQPLDDLRQLVGSDTKNFELIKFIIDNQNDQGVLPSEAIAWLNSEELLQSRLSRGLRVLAPTTDKNFPAVWNRVRTCLQKPKNPFKYSLSRKGDKRLWIKWAR